MLDTLFSTRPEQDQPCGAGFRGPIWFPPQTVFGTHPTTAQSAPLLGRGWRGQVGGTPGGARRRTEALDLGRFL